MSSILLSGCMKKVEIMTTKSFNFSYSVGTYMNASYNYGLELKKDGRYVLSYKPAGVSEEDKMEKEISKDDVLELEKILIKNNISKWDGFHKTDSNVLDGNDFFLNYYRDDSQSISASGYMKYPSGYNDFKNDIISFYSKIFPESEEKAAD